MEQIDKNLVKTYLLGLQDSICAELQAEDGAQWQEDSWVREEGGGGRSRVVVDGPLIEKAGVNFSHVFGDQMPASATQNRRELAGRSFEAMGVSLVIHPNNPYVPTSHANVRFFIAENLMQTQCGGSVAAMTWLLTMAWPDCVHWHSTAKQACDGFSEQLYPRFKRWCDDYFYLKHRDEPRGVGGLFFDDFNELGFEQSFAFMRSVGDSFTQAYLPIVQRRRDMVYGDRERSFQLYRRGRYVEFNLVHDRGTLFGLQTGGRTESILMSLPPLVRWEYNWQPETDSAEAELYEKYLLRRDWV